MVMLLLSDLSLARKDLHLRSLPSLTRLVSGGSGDVLPRALEGKTLSSKIMLERNRKGWVKMKLKMAEKMKLEAKTEADLGLDWVIYMVPISERVVGGLMREMASGLAVASSGGVGTALSLKMKLKIDDVFHKLHNLFEFVHSY